MMGRGAGCTGRDYPYACRQKGYLEGGLSWNICVVNMVTRCVPILINVGMPG